MEEKVPKEIFHLKSAATTKKQGKNPLLGTDSSPAKKP
jgi:hypothetical protein